VHRQNFQEHNNAMISFHNAIKWFRHDYNHNAKGPR
jgi:hypothetical protein